MKINTNVSAQKDELISIATGDFDNHSTTPYLVLIDFTFYGVLVEYVNLMYRQDNGSYKINEHVTLQPSTDITTVVDYFRDGGYTNTIAFERYLVEANYIKPLNTRSIQFGHEDELEIYEYLQL